MMNLRYAASLVPCVFGELYLWCDAFMLRCIFGGIHLWWCLVGAITIVQCIFDVLFLGLGCNIFLVLLLWCYALSAISRWLLLPQWHICFIPDNDTLIFGVPNSYFPFSIGFFSFFRFCDAPCEKEETAFICASNGSLYRFYCSQRLRDFQNIFSKDQNQEQMRDVTRALWSPCLPGGRNFSSSL